MDRCDCDNRMAMYINVDARKEKNYCSRRGDGENFKALYRFSYENVQWMTYHFLPVEGDPRGGGLSNLQKMKTFLRYVGDPGFQVGVGEDIGIHQTTACKIIWYVCQEITSKASDWINFPSTDEELREAKMNWTRNKKIPNAVGAIDCTHILIVRPHHHPDEFINRKGQASFNVQATCDANDIFTSVDCCWPGSVHDSRIWRNSEIYQVMYENTVGTFLLGDEGYGIAPWVMTPYRNPDTPDRAFYNKLHCRERVGIERVFGQVKRRFPFLLNTVRMSTARVPAMILACFILHNVAKFLQDEDFQEEDGQEVAYAIDQSTDDTTVDIRIRGSRRRDAIAAYLRHNYGNLDD